MMVVCACCFYYMLHIGTCQVKVNNIYVDFAHMLLYNMGILYKGGDCYDFWRENKKAKG